jgi:hypothetical protein
VEGRWKRMGRRWLTRGVEVCNRPRTRVQVGHDYTLAASGGKRGSISVCLGRHVLGAHEKADSEAEGLGLQGGGRRSKEWVSHVVLGSGRGGRADGTRASLAALCVAVARDPLTTGCQPGPPLPSATVRVVVSCCFRVC